MLVADFDCVNEYTLVEQSGLVNYIMWHTNLPWMLHMYCSSYWLVYNLFMQSESNWVLSQNGKVDEMHQSYLNLKSYSVLPVFKGLKSWY